MAQAADPFAESLFGEGRIAEQQLGVGGRLRVERGGGVDADAEVGDALAELGDTCLGAPLYETFACSAGMSIACFPDMPPGTWIVENVGTREDSRRHGLVRALLERALAEGRRNGHGRAQISCLIGNDPAQRAYERAGFEVVEERRDGGFEKLIGAPGFSRMTRSLVQE